MDAPLIFIFTKLASTAVFAVFCLLLVGYLALRHNIQKAAVFLGSALGLLISVTLLKEITRIPRPSDAIIEISGYAFPSAHAAGIIFLAITVSLLSRKASVRIRYTVYALLFFITAIVGMSRVYLHVHTPMQVLAGYVLGALWAYIWFMVDRNTPLISGDSSPDHSQ